MAAASRILLGADSPGSICRFVLYCALQPGRLASSTPPRREEVKSMTHLKTRLARAAWMIASLAALAAALGAPRKW
jgi:hypothetical protein